MRRASPGGQTTPCTAPAFGCIFLLGPTHVHYDGSMKLSGAFPQARGWLWIASIWLGIGLFNAVQTVFSMRAQGMHHAWPQLFVTQWLALVPWIFATPVVQYLGRRFPPLHWKPLYAWLIHLGACLAIAVISAIWLAGIEELLNPWAIPGGPADFLPLSASKVGSDLLSDFVVYVAVLAIAYVLDSKDRIARQQTEAARLNEALSKAQLYALRRQLEPHFLFNALNAISGLVREERNDDAVSMIAGLSDFLRRVLQDSDRQEVALGEEMDFVQKYLGIQKVRFADSLKVDIQVPDELLSAQLPPLILQPLAENAVKHGIAKRSQGGTIRISARRSDTMLNLTVYNDGPKHRAGPNSGIGISNVRSRLQRLYGDKFQLSIRDEGSDGVEVCVSVPFRQK